MIGAAEDATRKVAAARQKVSDLDAQADELAERRADTDRATAERGAELVAAVRRHLEGTTELRIPDTAATMAQLELWVETLDGTNAAAEAVNAAGQTASAETARQNADFATRGSATRTRVDQLDEETARLERGEDDAPPLPHTRDATARDGRPGAPLWQLIDLADGLGETDRAGIEAALEASGILDAWVTPSGEALAADTEDVVLRAGDDAPVNLGSALKPAVDREHPQASAVSDAVVATLLATIGLGGHAPTWVDTDGRFRIGPLEGAWRKPVATYIGRGARVAARRARLTDLSAQRAPAR